MLKRRKMDPRWPFTCNRNLQFRRSYGLQSKVDSSLNAHLMIHNKLYEAKSKNTFSPLHFVYVFHPAWFCRSVQAAAFSQQIFINEMSFCFWHILLAVATMADDTSHRDVSFCLRLHKRGTICVCCIMAKHRKWMLWGLFTKSISLSANLHLKIFPVGGRWNIIFCSALQSVASSRCLGALGHLWVMYTRKTGHN